MQSGLEKLRSCITERNFNELLRLVDLFKGQGCYEEEWDGSLLLEALRSEFLPAVRLFLATEGIIRRPMKELRFPLDQNAEMDGTIIQKVLFRIYDDENFDWLDLLFEAGMSVEERIDEIGRTLLMAAAWNSAKLAKQLLEGGAEIDSQDRDGDTALMYACMTDITFLIAPESIEMVRLLLQAGADRRIKNIKGKTAMDIAKSQQLIDAGNEAVQRLLME